MMGTAMPLAWPFGPALACPPASHRARAFAAVAGLLAVLAFFTIATALVFQQWLPHLGSALIGPPEDNMQDFWNTWYAAVGRQPGQFFFTDLLRFPEGTFLHLHAFAYPKVFAIAPPIELSAYEPLKTLQAGRVRQLKDFAEPKDFNLLSKAEFQPVVMAIDAHIAAISRATVQTLVNGAK